MNAFYDIFMVLDLTQSTDANRVKFYINGYPEVLSFSGSFSAFTTTVSGTTGTNINGAPSDNNVSIVDFLGFIPGVVDPDFITTSSNQYINDDFWTIGNIFITEFNVTYDGNGSDSGHVEDPTTYNLGDSVTVLGDGDLLKAGYTFRYWNTQSDGSGTTYNEGDVFSISSDITLYALWGENPQFILLEQEGGTKFIDIEWDTGFVWDNYSLERSINDPTFSSPVEVYLGSDKTFTDEIPSYYSTYYYRVKGIITSPSVVSAWSNVEDIYPIGLISSFTADPLSGNANLAVQFTDTSLGTPTSWDWTFGDGYTSTEQNPIHIYETAGTYSVTLEVHDSLADSSHTEIDYITVGITADFYAVNRTGAADLTVSFYDTSLGNPNTWDWDFGDGSTHSTEQNPTHTYTSPGYYTVTLTSSIGAFSDIETKANYVTVYTAANFEGDPRKGSSNLTVQFHDLTKGNPITWYWSFGDGTYSNEQNPSHYYSRPGTYTVSLTAASSFNGDTETKGSYIIIAGIATIDVAPTPDLTMYLFNTEAVESQVGIKIQFRNQD